MPAWGASRSVKNYLWEFSFSIQSSCRPPLRGAQPLASLQVGRQPPRHGLVRCFSSWRVSQVGRRITIVGDITTKDFLSKRKRIVSVFIERACLDRPQVAPSRWAASWPTRPERETPGWTSPGGTTSATFLCKTPQFLSKLSYYPNYPNYPLRMHLAYPVATLWHLISILLHRLNPHHN